MTSEGDSGVFEINDYTVVTPMEQFITSVESALTDWELTGQPGVRKYSKGSLSYGKLEARSKIVKLSGSTEFVLTHYFPQEKYSVEVTATETKACSVAITQMLSDIRSSAFDLLPGNDVVQKFGVSEFIVLCPVNPHKEKIALEDDLEWLRSALRTAAQDCQCYVPIFVQFGLPQKKLFFGVGLGPETFTSFETAFLRQGQKQHLHLSGLLKLFKNKVASPTIRDEEEIRTSIMFEYRNSAEAIPDHGILNEDTVLVPFRLDKCAIGSSSSPISKISLLALWPNQSEDVVNESSTYSDLDHLSAFEWQLFMEFDPSDGCLAEGLEDLIAVIEDKNANRKVKERLGITDHQYDLAMGIRFDENPYKKSKFAVGDDDEFALKPLEDGAMMRWIHAVFRFVENPDEIPASISKETTSLLEAMFSQSNGCSINCVCSRLARAFLHLSMNNIHPKDAQYQLWSEFVKALRSRYDRGEDITDTRNLKEPNLLKCLFHQKLEMLQCCLENRRQRHLLYNSAETFGDDEFFDAVEDMGRDKPSDRSPDGRLKQHEGMFLLDHPDIPLFNFITQNAAPMTEDMVVAQQEYLEGLNDEDRQKAQLSSLISDIQAFKAANPFGSFADFVRWHSPKDWDEDKSCLSERFSNSDSVWLKCWQEARPVPVMTQARLFNETTVAEEVLYKLENATLKEVADWLLPSLLTSAATQLLLQNERLGNLANSEHLKNAVVKATRYRKREDYLNALEIVSDQEKTVMVYEAVMGVLHTHSGGSEGISAVNNVDLTTLAAALVLKWKATATMPQDNIIPTGVPIAGTHTSPLGHCVRRMMAVGSGSSAASSFPDVFRRFYTMRWSCVRPSPGSRQVPQRMFAILSHDEFLVSGSFTDDVLFA